MRLSMLPVQDKMQDEQIRPAQTTLAAVLSPGNMVNAADELLQRLSDIDLEQIASATERLSVLKTGLFRLQRSLQIVSEMAACQSTVDQAAGERTAELNDLRTKILEALAQLRPQQETPGVLVAKASSTDSDDDQFPSADFQYPIAPGPINLESNSTGRIEFDEPGEAASDTLQEPEFFSSIDVLSTATATGDKTTNSESPPTSGNERPDFAFLKGTSATSNFEFTDEASDNDRSYTFEEASPSIEPQVKNAEDLKSSIAASDSVEFDKKLLDDLIKNYGEFAVSSKPPSTGELSAPPEKGESSSAPKPTAQSNSAMNRSVPAYQTHGEFDQKLKKLIKDYGQVDLYSQHSSGKTKLRALAAFAVLGAVLSGIYYFSSPKSAPAPNAAPTKTQGLDGNVEQTATDNSSSVDTKNPMPVQDTIPLVGQVPPQTVEASETFGVTDKHDIKKNIKRGGSKQ